MNRKIVFLSDINTTDITPILYGSEKCLPNYSYGPIARNTYILHYVLSGKGYLEIGGKKFDICAGQLFVIKPNEMAFYKADELDPWHYSFVNFNTTLTLPALLNSYCIDDSGFAHIFKAFSEYSEADISNVYYICGKLFELFSYIESETPQLAISSFALKAKNYIETFYNTHITIEGIAKQLSIDRRYLYFLFKKQFNMSPQQYLVDFRMKKAAYFLTVHNLSPGETALLCGYPDVFSFSKMFKQKFNVSPLNYKKIMD